ncbi:oxidoreductase [Nocardioides sp. AX2bis]|uniref:oxidoreductase n=1 Tax=Nocardioides sp. AX2bis TaxID=2653157 RepID=UPI0012F05B3F|nr:oxidoreductase [Nocardioides sp. AX2bis]VXB97848.1 Short-chain dehydrogenase/reductase SDR [Nocardioides sp. AX2bis]
MSSAAVAPWTLADVPDQAGRTAVVTGPSLGGLGHHTALELARRGARVVLAGRNADKLDATARAVTAELGGDQPAPEQLVVDLADLTSVRAAARRAADLGPLHLLVNNAGVMGTPERRTPDGLELQMATNHFGPFLLTGLLLPQLVAAEDARVVTVSSLMHRRARSAPLDDPRQQGRYRKWQAYAQSKLANLLFTFELERRLRDAGLPISALAAHPGFAGSHLAANGQFGGAAGGLAGRASTVYDAAVRAVAQPVAAGAWPTLMAATADLPGGTYCGPDGPGQMRGRPQVVTASSAAQDPEAQRALWDLSERTVGLTWP